MSATRTTKKAATPCKWLKYYIVIPVYKNLTLYTDAVAEPFVKEDYVSGS